MKVFFSFSHILISENDYSLNLMYHLSMNDDAKAMIAYTDVIQAVSFLMIPEISCYGVG